MTDEPEYPFDSDLPEEPGDELARMAQETIQEQVGSTDVANIRVRCQRVIDLYAKGSIQDSRDNFHAALVLLYGEKTAHYDLSRTFSRRAALMGEARAWTLFAMSWDRWLISLGQPQRFGTQIIKREGRWSLGAVDTTISDLERAMYAVPPLFVQQQRAEQLQRQEDANE
ncbi:MAG: hypothetical protein HC837_09475 [Chloroflexaceae bacterium]|nr:hypothetical protein [Chloroflexaceae bacterium]